MGIEKPQLKKRWRIRSEERLAILFIGDLIVTILCRIYWSLFLGAKGLAGFFLGFPWATCAILVLPVTLNLDPFPD